MKKLSALEFIEIDGVPFSTGDTFNIDDGTAQELINTGKAELVPDLVKNDIQSEDGVIDRSAYEAGMDREEEATGDKSRLDPKKLEKLQAKRADAAPVTPPIVPPKPKEPAK